MMLTELRRKWRARQCGRLCPRTVDRAGVNQDVEGLRGQSVGLRFGEVWLMDDALFVEKPWRRKTSRPPFTEVMSCAHVATDVIGSLRPIRGSRGPRYHNSTCRSRERMCLIERQSWESGGQVHSTGGR